MRVVNAMRTLYRDVRCLGPGIVREYIDGRRGRRVTQVRLRAYGPFTLRPRTSDLQVVRDVLRDQEYDMSRLPHQEALQREYERILARGRTPLIIDLGANIGAASLWYSRRYPKAHVIAVEPDPTNAELCRQNTSGRDVEVVLAAIGCTEGSASLHDAGDEKWAVSTERNDRGSTPIHVVNDLVRAANGCELFIVKIDIEGFESDLFAANTEWVANAALVVIEPHDWMLPGSATSRNFQRLFGDLDYDVLICGQNLAYVRRAA